MPLHSHAGNLTKSNGNTMIRAELLRVKDKGFIS